MTRPLPRNYVIYALIALGLMGLALEFVLFLPDALERWRPWDYGNYVLMGRALREGINPYGPHRFYPLPTILWIFAPLSLAPDWFRVIWILVSFAAVLRLFRLNGLWLFLFPPLWFVVTDAMFDAWLLIPLAWLFQNRRTLAPVGAALLLFKPHVTAFAVVFVLISWLWAHDWRRLAIFSGVFSIIWIPSFLVDPSWINEMLAALPDRVAYISILPLRTTAISSWWTLGGFSVLVFGFLLYGLGILFLRAVKISSTRAQAFQLLQLLLLPTMLASNVIMAIPTLHERNEILVIVLVGLAAYALDRALGGFGGGYAFIPLAALYFQTRRATVGVQLEHSLQ